MHEHPPKTDYVFLFHRTNTEDRVAQSNLDGGLIMSPKADRGNYGLELFYARLSLDDGDGHDLCSYASLQLLPETAGVA